MQNREKPLCGPYDEGGHSSPEKLLACSAPPQQGRQASRVQEIAKIGVEVCVTETKLSDQHYELFRG